VLRIALSTKGVPSKLRITISVSCAIGTERGLSPDSDRGLHGGHDCKCHVNEYTQLTYACIKNILSTLAVNAVARFLHIASYMYTHAYTYTYMHTLCVCVCVFVCL
jgi:hypothetical protein